MEETSYVIIQALLVQLTGVNADLDDECFDHAQLLHSIHTDKSINENERLESMKKLQKIVEIRIKQEQSSFLSS